jgi:hypothetical protein
MGSTQGSHRIETLIEAAEHQLQDGALLQFDLGREGHGGQKSFSRTEEKLLAEQNC